jgi:hypothetical protein
VADYPVWVALLLGIVGMAILFALWAVLERQAGFAEAITVERDGGAALRLAAFLAALGFLLGLALPQLLALPASWQPVQLLAGPGVLFLAAVLLENRRGGAAVAPRFRPRVVDVLVALVYLGVAGAWVYLAREAS